MKTIGNPNNSTKGSLNGESPSIKPPISPTNNERV